MFGLYIPIRHRSVDIAGSAMPMQKIETVDISCSEALASGQTSMVGLYFPFKKT
jgi:hypothetical protein